MFSARQGFFAPSGGIVTQNLKLYLDATNSASYPGSGSTWFDLSGNNFHATISANWTYETSPVKAFVTGTNTASIRCNGTVAGSTSATSTNLNINGSKPKTVCVLAQTPSVFISTGIWEIGDGGASGSQFSFRRNDGQPTSWRVQMVGTADIDFTYTSVNTWDLWSLVFNGTSTTMYRRNSINMASNIFTLNTGTTTPFSLNRYGGAGGMCGRYSQALVYDRALSTAEIDQNWEAVKGLVGL